MSTPTPPRIAAAIADLAADQVREAWHYTSAWSRLGAASPESPVGVPLLELRHALERPRSNTRAVAAVKHWDGKGARGLLGLSSKAGRGKSHAAACWALDRAREHKDTLWIACANWPAAKDRSAERDALIRRASYASALVLDDVGAGSSSAPWVGEQMEGFLMARVARASTIFLTNMEGSAIAAWLGIRLWDRLAYAGGIVTIDGGESMRDLDSTPVDELGRSDRWLACMRLVDLIGCQLVDGALVVGGALNAAVLREGHGPNNAATELLGLNRATVLARARHIESCDRNLVRENGLDVDVSAGLTYQDVAPALILRIVENQQREELEQRARADGYARARRELAPVEVDLAAMVAPAQLGAAKRLASAWRVRVLEDDAGSWRVVRLDGFELAAGLPTEALAYYHAALSVRQYQAASKDQAVSA